MTLPFQHASRWTSALAVGLLAWATLVAQPGHAQTQRQWISLFGSPPGTPSRIVLDTQASSTQSSFFDIFVEGFWLENVVGGDNQTYQKITVPGFPGLNMLGAPDVPVVRHHLGIVTGAQRLMQEQFSVLDLRTFSNVNAWPQPYEAEDHPGWSQERFTKDQLVYSMTSPYPMNTSVAGSVGMDLDPVPGAMFEAYPFRVIPAAQQLQVAAHARVGFSHTGTPTPYPEITRDRAGLMNQMYLNWSLVSAYAPTNLILYKGDFLFVYESQYADEIKPLVDQKKARGYAVTETVIGATGNTCASIRTLIQVWHAGRPADRDHYCILVGDVGVIPLCTSPFGTPTDDMYADADGNGVDDLAEEVYLGRLSVDNEADLANQVGKILAYESGMPPCAQWLDDVTLIAHKEGAPGKYEGAHEDVRTFAYSQVVPIFHTVYGSNAANSNATITAEVNAGRNIVAYRGHGDWDQWWSWNQTNQSYFNADVAALANGSKTPVVWSIACNTAELGQNDCFGETWMEQVGKGAVGFYGSTVPSGTDANHELDRRLFRAVYDLGLTKHSHAIWCAEHWTEVAFGGGNPWMYLLLGDPEMTIRRTNTSCTSPWIVSKPSYIPVGCKILNCCPTCQGPPIDILVMDENANPVPGIKVAYIKFGQTMVASPGDGSRTLLAQVDEAQDNRYTLSDGWAHIPAPPLTSGQVVFTIVDGNGNSYTDSIAVLDLTAVGEPGGPAAAMHATPSVTSAWSHVHFGRPIEARGDVSIQDVTGRTIRTLAASAGEAGVLWDGRDDRGVQAAPGVYLVTLRSADQRATTRVVLTN